MKVIITIIHPHCQLVVTYPNAIEAEEVDTGYTEPNAGRALAITYERDGEEMVERTILGPDVTYKLEK